MFFVRLPKLCVLDVIGKDAAKIAQNLCTANIETIGSGRGREAFITDVRGKTLGHVCIYKTTSGLRLIGAGAAGDHPNQAGAISTHFDKYTLREQSVPEDHSDDFAAIVVTPELLAKLDGSIATLATDSPNVDLSFVDFQLALASGTLDGHACRVPWWAGATVVILVDPSQVDALADYLAGMGGIEADQGEFDRRRVENRFPWFGIDINSRHLPQEADRDSWAISFTKGCYLGQETVARLDALGQVQKKLVIWNLKCSVMPAANTELKDQDRIVGRLTTVANDHGDQSFVALGFARRSHFEAGSKAVGVTDEGQVIEAQVSDLA